MREPSLQRPRRGFKRTVRTDGLIILSGEDLLFAEADELLRGIHLPLFEAHFGPVWPREALDEAWKRSSFDRGGGSRARLARLAAMLSRLATSAEEGDRKVDFAHFARALWSWLALVRSPSTGSLARFIAGRGELAKALVPVLSFSVDLDARLRALRLPGCRPGLKLLQSVLPASLGLAALTGLPTSVLGSVENIGRFWRIWDDGLRSPVTTLAADLGIARCLADEEAGAKPRFGGGRLLLIGTRDGDRRLAKSLGADFVEVRSGLEEEALLGLARGFAALRPSQASVSENSPA
ncbi:MAG TPA: hypothetical protein VMV83_08590 [Rectinemataceae bacterium]|nr:hypothetical protein [Rectinemataceae bacterium]